MWWLLTREVLRLRGSISREVPWEIMVDLYFYRDPNEEVIISIVTDSESVTESADSSRVRPHPNPGILNRV